MPRAKKRQDPIAASANATAKLSSSPAPESLFGPGTKLSTLPAVSAAQASVLSENGLWTVGDLISADQTVFEDIRLQCGLDLFSVLSDCLARLETEGQEEEQKESKMLQRSVSYIEPSAAPTSSASAAAAASSAESAAAAPPAESASSSSFPVPAGPGVSALARSSTVRLDHHSPEKKASKPVEDAEPVVPKRFQSMVVDQDDIEKRSQATYAPKFSVPKKLEGLDRKKWTLFKVEALPESADIPGRNPWPPYGRHWRKQYNREEAKFSSMRTGKTLKADYAHERWKGLLRVTEKKLVDSSVRDVLDTVSYWWTPYLTDIVVDYLGDEFDKLKLYTVEMDARRLEELLAANTEFDPDQLIDIFNAVALHSKEQDPSVSAHFPCTPAEMQKYIRPRPPRLTDDKLETLTVGAQNISALSDKETVSLRVIDGLKMLTKKALSVTLYDYQLRSIAWMLDLERQVRENRGLVLTDDDLKWGGVDTNLRFDYLRRKITNADDPFVQKRVLTFRGGVLADQMGLGKTLTTIGLIMVLGADQVIKRPATAVVVPKEKPSAAKRALAKIAAAAMLEDEEEESNRPRRAAAPPKKKAAVPVAPAKEEEEEKPARGRATRGRGKAKKDEVEETKPVEEEKPKRGRGKKAEEPKPEEEEKKAEPAKKGRGRAAPKARAAVAAKKGRGKGKKEEEEEEEAPADDEEEKSEEPPKEKASAAAADEDAPMAPAAAEEASEDGAFKAQVHPDGFRFLPQGLATLIVCPSHLVHQWSSEITKHVLPEVASKLRVHVITTVGQHEALTYEDLIKADVVVASVQLFLNPNFYKHGMIAKTRTWTENVRNAFTKMLQKGQDLMMRTIRPFFDHLQWKRLIIDEAHELFSAKMINNTIDVSSEILGIPSDCRWYLSGTPFPDTFFTPRGAMRFLGVSINGMNVMDQEVDADRNILKLVAASEKQEEEEMYLAKQLDRKRKAEEQRKLNEGMNAGYGFGYYHYDYVPHEQRVREEEEDWKAVAKERAESQGPHTPSAVSQHYLGSVMQTPLGGVLEWVLYSRLFSRWTKATIGTVFDIPPYTNAPVLLEMSDIEKGVYRYAEDNYKNDSRRVMLTCAHPQLEFPYPITLAEFASLNNIREQIINYGQRTINQLTTEITAAENDLKRYNEVVKECTDRIREGKTADPWGHSYEKRRKSAEESIPRTEERIEKLNTRKNQVSQDKAYYDKLKPLPSIPKDTPYKPSEPAAGKSDMDEDKETKKEEEEAPKTKSRRRGREEESSTKPQKVSKASAKEDASSSAEVKEASGEPLSPELIAAARRPDPKLVNEYGTKVASVVEILRGLCGPGQSNRLIIFSQWAGMLERLRGAMDACSVKYVLCKGNVMRREQAIQGFHSEGGAKVLLLSLDSAASGTNLTEATHILLLDPVTGSKEEAEATEAQAIGRAFRQGQKKKLVVIRLIMENTMEHAFYNRNIAPSVASAALSHAPSVARANTLLAEAGAKPILSKAEANDDGIKPLDMDD